MTNFYPILFVLPFVFPQTANVFVPQDGRFTYIAFDLTYDDLPDENWVRLIINKTQAEVRNRFHDLSDYVFRDVDINVNVEAANPEAAVYLNRDLTVTRLIDMFFDEEFEITGKDEPGCIITIQSVQKHLQYVWIREAHERGINVRALENADQKELDSLLRQHILGKTLHGERKVKVARRRGGILYYTGDTGDSRRAAECYVGLRYTRKVDKEMSLRDLQNLTSMMMKHYTT